jgi:hypothetical protein
MSEEDGGRFFGAVEIARDGDTINHGYVLGMIDGSGTALIIDEEQKLLAYTPASATHPPWIKMSGRGADMNINDRDEITISPADVSVAALSNW